MIANSKDFDVRSVDVNAISNTEQIRHRFTINLYTDGSLAYKKIASQMGDID